MNRGKQTWPHRSFKLTGFGEPLREQHDQIGAPAGKQVLLRVLACGVCHSDLHLSDGFFDLGGGKRMDLGRGIALPRTLGHEIAGEVVAVGEQVTGLAIGDRRLLYPWIGCGDCGLCSAGAEHLCPQPRHHGTTVDGGFSNFVMVPDARYLLAFDPLPESFAATLACSGLTAYSALCKAGAKSASDPLLIIGAGGVGLAAISIACALSGVGPVVAEIDGDKREGALAAGASEVVDPRDPDVKRRLMKHTGGGFAAAVDFVGATATVELGMNLLRKGGRLVVVGLYGGSMEFSLPTLPLRSVSLMGSYVGSLKELEELMALARDLKLNPMQIVPRTLGSTQAVLEDLRAGRIRGRAVIIPSVTDSKDVS